MAPTTTTKPEDRRIVKSKASRKHRKPKAKDPLEDLPPKQCFLDRLPLELLAEVLLYMPSTKCVLALARCSKYFCATLVRNEASMYIWKAVRARSKPAAIPDPTPNFTEPAYAAFIFDGGECEVCKRYTGNLYTSFALCIRLCGKPSCRTHVQRKSLTDGSAHSHEYFMKYLPCLESNMCFESGQTLGPPLATLELLWPSCPKKYRVSEWGDAFVEHVSNSDDLKAYEKLHELDAKRLSVKMELAVSLYTWKRKRDISHRVIRKKNEGLAKSIATPEGWVEHDLTNSFTYGAMHHNRTNCFEEVRMKDYEDIKLTVEAEMLKIIEQRKRKEHESSYRLRRVDVKKHYDRLRSSKTKEVLPTLAQFRLLPFVNILQSRPTTVTGTTGDFQKSDLLADLIQSDLKTWRERTKEAFAVKLGYPKWKSASKNKLHPVDRLAARFKCTKCHKETQKFAADACLDFAGVCGHVCPRMDWNKQTREKWDIDQFEKDERAIDAITQVITLCGVSPESPDSRTTVEALGNRVKCRSCHVVMGFQNVIGHAQRHDKVDLSLLSDEEAKAASLATHEPLAYGTCSRIMGPSSTTTKRLRGSEQYGCRHCAKMEKSKKSNEQGASATATDMVAEKDVPKSKGSKEGRVFNFNGIRSHLKEKHGVERIRDEDVFSNKPLATSDSDLSDSS